jgi:cyclopropane fatty-acyl-phospholipid synthase-like methyltransferase
MVDQSERDSVEHYFADPDKYVRNNPYVELRSRAVKRMLPVMAHKTVLDLGCGDGRVSLPLIGPTDQLLLVDSSQGMLAAAAANIRPELSGRVRIQRADVGAFQPPGTFDVVLCIGLLAHVPDVPATLELVTRCVGEGGCALLQLTDDTYFFGRLGHWAGALHRRFVQPGAHVPNHMTLDSISAGMKRLGFELTRSYRYACVPGVRLLPMPLTRAVVNLGARRPASYLGGEILALFTRAS